MDDRRVTVNMADLHGGHQLGLLRPGTVLLEVDPKTGNLVGEEQPLGAWQEELWSRYEGWLEEACEFADGDPIDLLVSGDVAQGLTHTEHCFATCREHQIEVAVRCLQRAVEMLYPERVIILQGTAVHSKQGTIEAWVAYELQRRTGIRCWAIYHGLIDIGVTLDAIHKGPSKGVREWLEGNQARYYLRDRMEREIHRDHRPPRLYSRAHFHVYRREYLEATWRGQIVQSDLVLIPALCGMTAYAREVTRGEPYLSVGLVAYEICSGQLKEIRPMITEVDFRTRL